MARARLAAETVVRPLDPAERYFWLLDRLSPMTVVAVAELAHLPDATSLRRALDRVQWRHRLLRVAVATDGGELVFVDTANAIPLETVTPGTPWASVLAAELDRPFPAGAAPCVRCVVIPTAGDAGVLLVAAHHAVADGLGVVRVAQELLRVADGAASPGGVDDPSGVHGRFPPGLVAPRAVVTVASAVRAERAGQDPPAALPFHHRSAEARRSRVDRSVLPPAGLHALQRGARQVGASVHGALAAAMLRAVAGCVGDGPQPVICLATPTDLRRRVEPPIDPDAVVLAVGMLVTPYAVGAEDAHLARTVTEQTHRELERGESHLFYRLARAAGFPPSDEGVASFGSAFAAAPQNVAVSNLGVVDDAGDPTWVRSIGFALGTSDNQPAFLAATTYRGHLVLHLATDESRLDAGAADTIGAGLARHLAGSPVIDLPG